MSVDQYQRAVNGLDKEIADLEKKKAAKDKDIATLQSKIVSIEKSREKRIYPVKPRKTKQKPAFLATRTAKLLRFYYS